MLYWSKKQEFFLALFNKKEYNKEMKGNLNLEIHTVRYIDLRRHQMRAGQREINTCIYWRFISLTNC